MDACAAALRGKGVPMQVRKKSGDFRPNHDSVKVITMKFCKGLEFPMIALSGVGLMPVNGEAEREETRLFYVASTRAKQRLVIGVSGRGGVWRGWRSGEGCWSRDEACNLSSDVRPLMKSTRL
jgi:superfamily I DNA/RNA helicase